MKIKGSGTYTDATGRSYKILGVSELSDDKKLRELKILGDISFDKIFCDSVDISGKCEGKSINTKNFSASGKTEIDSIKVEQTFELKGKPELGNVEADEIIIESYSGSIGEVKCRKVKIFDFASKAEAEFVVKIFGKEIPDVDKFSRVRIKNIEAEKVEPENCEVETIKCKNAFIGSNCTVEKLFVAGECKVAVDSKVGETIRT